MERKIQGSIFQIESEVDWEQAGEGVMRQVYGYDDKIMLLKVKFEKDAVGAMHHHPHSQVTYITSGVFEMTIGDEKRIICKGDGYYVPPHIVHGITCIEEGMLIDVFSPIREDFMPAKNHVQVKA